MQLLSVLRKLVSSVCLLFIGQFSLSPLFISHFKVVHIPERIDTALIIESDQMCGPCIAVGRA